MDTLILRKEEYKMRSIFFKEQQALEERELLKEALSKPVLC